MLLRDQDTAAFKKWLLPKLETISDADAEVLADYVIALITANVDEEGARQGCLEDLVDFLGDGTSAFVEEVLATLRNREYVVEKKADERANGTRATEGRAAAATRTIQSARAHGQQNTQAPQTAPIPSIVGKTTNAEYEPRPSRASNTLPPSAPTGPRNGLVPPQSNAPEYKIKGKGAKKRKQPHRDAGETPDTQDTGARPKKQATRRGMNGAGANSLRAGAASFVPQNTAPAFAPLQPVPNPFVLSNLPPPPPGPMPFNVNDPMAFFTMMAALGMNMPGMSPLPNNMPNSMPMSNGVDGQAKVGKCHSYHEKGYCVLGNMCSFQHGESEAVPEYDPTQPSLSMKNASSTVRRPGVNKNYGKSGRPRADISLPGPTQDRSLTTLVVEQIPREHFNEEDVRDYFSEFGTIVDVEMHNYKRVAIVKYEDHSAASRAYNSPKAVFENRFIKVYWKRPDMTFEGPSLLPDDAEMEDGYEDEDPVMSPEEIAQRQAEAQQAFEERRRKREETEARAAEIDRLLKEKDAEMRAIKKQLAELAGEEETESNRDAIKDFSRDLATLQAEAENLFGTAETPSFAGRGAPVRGGYRGRAQTSFSTRGRGFAPLRGRGAPRGGFAGRGRVAVSVRRLDNRPRRLAVSGIDKGSAKDEALRQYLLVSRLSSCV